MKRITLLFIALLTSTVMSLGHAAPSNEQSLDQIIAIVNDAVITQSELNHAIQLAKQQLASSNMPTPPDKTLQKQVLDQLIDRKLQLQLAEQLGMHVDNTMLQKAMAQIAKENHMNVSELLERVAQSGMNVSDYKKELREQILIQQIQQQQVASKITITDQEVKDFMRSASYQASNNKEYHLEDILIALPDSPTPNDIASAKQKAAEVLAKIRNGLNFNEAAVSESGSNKALQGGDLGWRKLPEVPSAFAESIMNMKEGDIAGPLQAANGFHLVRLSGLRNTSSAAIPYKQVEQMIFQRKLEEALQSWTTKLHSEAFINMHPEG